MTPHAHGVVTALEYRTRPEMAFADIVEEFDIALQFVDATKRSLTWDCEDIAVIERDNLRIGLGWLPSEEPGTPWYLIFAVGPVQDRKLPAVASESLDFLAQRIVERTSEFLPADAVLHGEAGQPVSPDLIDTLLDLLRQTATARRDDAPAAQPQRDRAAREIRVSPAMPDAADGETIDAGADEGRVAQAGRRWLPALQGQASGPMRLSIHTFALTLMLHVPALGAFLFVYGLLRDVHPIAT